MKEARQNFMTMVLYKDHAKWVIAYIEQCFTVYYQNETPLNDGFQVTKRGLSHWSFTLIDDDNDGGGGGHDDDDDDDDDDDGDDGHVNGDADDDGCTFDDFSGA